MTPQEVRTQLVAALEADLVLPLPPSRWYLTGFLAPHFDRAPDPDDPDAQGELAAGSESQAEDAGTTEPDTKRQQRFPASMGLSVFLPPAPTPSTSIPDHIEVELRYADYLKEEISEDTERKAKDGWRRIPRGPYTIKVPLDPKQLASHDGIRWPESPMLCIRGELRSTSIDGLPPGTRVLSLFLVNDRLPLERDRDLNFIFQVGFTLRYPGGFIARPNRRGEDSDDDDQRVLALMFRDRYEWAVGHNTSVDMPRPDPDGLVRELRTTQLPQYEVRLVRHETVKGIETEMRRLSQMEGPGLVHALSPLVEAYGAWVEKQRYAQLERSRLEEIRDSLMARAQEARTRMQEGIDLLAKDAEIREAWKLANVAMHAQALQADGIREDKRYLPWSTRPQTKPDERLGWRGTSS